MIPYPQVFVVTLKEAIPCSPLQIVAFNMISCMVATVNGDWVHTTIGFEFLYETTQYVYKILVSFCHVCPRALYLLKEMLLECKMLEFPNSSFLVMDSNCQSGVSLLSNWKQTSICCIGKSCVLEIRWTFLSCMQLKMPLTSSSNAGR